MQEFNEGDIKLFLTSWPNGQLQPVKLLKKRDDRQGPKVYWCIEYLVKGGTDTTNSDFLFELPNNWISVKDRPPEPEQGNKVLGFNGDYIFECEFDDGFWCNLGGDEMTHWMPLPDTSNAL